MTDTPVDPAVTQAIEAAPVLVATADALAKEVKTNPIAVEATLEHAAPAILSQVGAISKEVKAGYKTTEFYVVILAALLADVGALPIPDHAKAYITAGLAAAYAIARGVAKAG